MTREEIKNIPEIVDFMLAESIIADSRIKLHKRLEELCKLAIKALEQESVLDNIRAEIAEYGVGVVYTITDRSDKDIEQLVSDILKQAKEQVLEVIDKYKAESEE